MENMVVNTMEILNTHPINDLVSIATIKVCYVSDKPNRNNTIINEEVGRQIAATLPGAPVVGLFNRDENDFEEHSRSFSFKDGEFVIEDMTRPYGFVSPVDKPWFQDFEEEGETRKYLMCIAYFWTRQYEEASLAMNKGQSMELDGNVSKGFYQDDAFIFTSATLDKLCILGDNYEPCFSGAKIISAFSKDYIGLAEQLETIIERGFYVMNDQLVAKQENQDIVTKINYSADDTVTEVTETIEATETVEVETPSANFTEDKVPYRYAIELGCGLTRAVHEQLRQRGAADKYEVKGIYSEAGKLYAILVDVISLEHVQCGIAITAQETIELGSEMLSIDIAWNIKQTRGTERIKPINGDNGNDILPTVPETVEPIETVPAGTYSQDPEMVETIREQGERLAKYEEDMETMQEMLAEYKVAAKKREEEDKVALVAEYSTLMSEEAVQEVVKDAGDCTLYELESKMAIAYARAHKKEKVGKTNFQLDIATPTTTTTDSQLPTFMKSALAIDNQIQ